MLADPTVLSWRRMISTDGNQYSWAFALSLATLPDKPISLMEICAYKEQQRHGACQQWLHRLTWIIYLSQSTCMHSSCTSTANNEAGEDAFMANTLIAPCINEYWLPSWKGRVNYVPKLQADRLQSSVIIPIVPKEIIIALSALTAFKTVSQSAYALGL